MRFVSFNVCGLKQLLGSTTMWVPERNYASMFNYLEGDVVCFQETKLQQRDIDKSMVLIPGFNAFYTSSRDRKGYSGVSIYVRDSIGVQYAEEGITGWLQPAVGSPAYRENSTLGTYPDIPKSEGLEIDGQGRALVVDLGGCVVFGLYCPANSQGNMEEYRTRFFELLDERVRSIIASGRNVVVMGDINVAREPVDSDTKIEQFKKDKVDWTVDDWKYGRPASKIVNDWVEQLGLVDTGREMHPNREKMFTCWNILINARPANFGSRIDYVFASKALTCTGADIWADLYGSDHCPIYADLKVEALPKRPLPLIARRLKQSFGTDIKSMFAKRASSTPPKAVPKESKAEPIKEISKPKEVSKESKDESIKEIPKPKGIQKPKSDQKKLGHFFGSSKSQSPVSPAKVPVKEPVKEPVTDSPKESSPAPSPPSSVGKVQSSESWQSIFKKKAAPLCNHHEPCVLQKAKKAGPNRGRSFWSCARPQGSENDPAFRCKFFEWA